MKLTMGNNPTSFLFLGRVLPYFFYTSLRHDNDSFIYVIYGSIDDAKIDQNVQRDLKENH